MQTSMIMKEQVLNRFLRLAFDYMNDQQLRAMAAEIEERMDYLKTYLIEHTEFNEAAKAVKEEYMTLKDLRSYFVVDLNQIN
jgi:hypothetical protein